MEQEVVASNRGVVYRGLGKVARETLPYPQFETALGRKLDHGVILKVYSIDICGSDQHRVRGRTTAPVGMVLGREITGEIFNLLRFPDKEQTKEKIRDLTARSLPERGPDG